MNDDLRGRRALVLAGTSGLGYATAEALRRRGADVIVNGHDADRLTAARDRLGPDTQTICGDLVREGGAEEVLGAVGSSSDGVDILISNGPGPRPARALDVTAEGLGAALRTNMLNQIAIISGLVPGMLDRDWGRVVAITSAAVREPNDGLVYSNVARSGLTAYLKTLSGSCVGTGVTINSVLPGPHDTERFRTTTGAGAAVGTPVGDPADFGEIVAFLCSASARFISGVALPVTGGTHHYLA